jgi:hypothetical protein
MSRRFAPIYDGHAQTCRGGSPCRSRRDHLANVPPSSVMNSRRFTAQYLPVLERKDSTPRYCRTAGFQSPQCPVWVSRVGLMRRRRSRHVRFYSDSVQTLEAQRNDALCHEPTYAVQQIARLFDCLAGIRGTEHYGTRKIDFAKTSQAITAVALAYSV